MTERDFKIAMELKRRLEESVRLVDFRVFGSRVRGNEDEYSDMDVFIEVESIDRTLKERIFDITWEVGFINFIVISPLIFTRDEIERSALKSSPIVRNIVAEGVSL